MKHPTVSPAAASLFVLLLAAPMLPAAGPVDYLRDVKPILTAHCYACHGILQQKAELRLDTAELLRRGGKHGPGIVPGKSNASLLVERITAGNGARLMPPKDGGEPLGSREIALIRAWIEQGGVVPPNEKPEPDPREHWAFRTPVRPPLPQPRNVAWVRNPIDAFIAAEHERHSLTPQPAADKFTLLRRLYLDLIGLPPTRQELEAFVVDKSTDAYEKVVDRLLTSPEYGERWGRHWMDVWRYSDWWGLGAEVRNSQKHVWHWRDWILESLNADKGYDQMVREMLAADELYPNDLDRLRATGFLARSYFKFNRNTWLDETVEHTCKAFLGLTLNCAKCHEHKYDPFPQADYYRMRAFFEPYQLRTDELPGETDLDREGLPRAFDCNLEAATYLFVRGNEKQPVTDRPLVPAVPAVLALGKLHLAPVTLPPEAYMPGLRPYVLADHLRATERQVNAARAALEQARKQVADLERTARRNPPVTGEKLPCDVKPILRDDFAAARPDWWAMTAGKWQYLGGKLTQQQDGDIRAVLRARPTPPADFQVRTSFTITGGKQWRSVGVSFDVAGGNEVLVYLSACAGGPKGQIAYRVGGIYQYPTEAALVRPIKLNQSQELTVRVRGPLVNVAINGEHVLAYRLPLARRAGPIELITYDAKAEFTGFELAALPTSVALAETGSPGKPLTLGQGRAAVVLAEKALATAEAQPAALRARAAADHARAQQPPLTSATALARDAARAERQVTLARAEEDLARAEMEAADKKPDGAKKLAAARDNLAKVRQALTSVSETYTPLRGSLKSLESNLETEASQSKPYPTTSTGRRSALARWMTDSRNPLTARVAVNHMWAHHFGKPLAPTIFDFGRKGMPPTHPALLDYLAVEFVQAGWSMKHLHRLMVTSNTYRMTSSLNGAAPTDGMADAENRYYWRMNPIRMESEVVRDSLLCLAGDLNRAIGGPAVDPVRDAQSRRRSLYFVHSHNDHHKFLSMFDEASVLECYRRDESIVPQQALALTNSAITLSAADRIVVHLNEQLGTVGDLDFVRTVFETVLANRPTDAEQAQCALALARLTDLARRHKIADPVRRARANLVNALLNHNDFITIR